MKKSLIVVMCLVCALLVAGPARATTLTLDYLIGTVEPAAPSSVSDELAYVNNLINWYNGDIGDPSNFVAGPPASGYTYTLAAGSLVPPPDLELATGGVKSAGEPGFPIDTTGYTYLWAKFGQDGALYWLDSITSVDAFDPAWGPFAQQGGGLSHITLFGPGTTQVPEAGTLMLLGFGLAGVGMVRRFLKR